jgi:hypothetical protein
LLRARRDMTDARIQGTRKIALRAAQLRRLKLGADVP